MKANKALKRLVKIEASMSDVAKRFSVSAPHIQGVLKDLKAAIVRVKEAVTAQTASGATKKKAATSKAGRAEKKASPARKNSAVKKAAAKSSTAKRAKRPARVKKATAKKKPPIVQATTEVPVEEAMSTLA